jgi:hypothetical protein
VRQRRGVGVKESKNACHVCGPVCICACAKGVLACACVCVYLCACSSSWLKMGMCVCAAPADGMVDLDIPATDAHRASGELRSRVDYER